MLTDVALFHNWHSKAWALQVVIMLNPLRAFVACTPSLASQFHGYYLSGLFRHRLSGRPRNRRDCAAQSNNFASFFLQ
eukprot:scaffold263332_cov18-Prasinocladus_malaysianus.AAC.1